MLQPSWSRGSIRGVVSDLDGVVYRGEAPIASSIEAFRRWREQGVPYAFVTNNSSLSASQFAEKLSRMGVAVTPAQIFTTIEASAALLRQRWPHGGRAYVIGERPLIEAVEDAGLTLAGTGADVVVIGFDSGLTYDKLRIATRAALRGAPVIATNPDALTPARDGYDPCVGMTIAAISAAVPEAEIVVVGKPQPFMIEQAVALLGVAKTDAIMIGDQLATDILAGQRAGLRSILLASHAPFNSASTATPDGIVASLLDLTEIPAGAGRS
jgi:4-nitrophenyl phosphatase